MHKVVFLEKRRGTLPKVEFLLTANNQFARLHSVEIPHRRVYLFCLCP